MKITRDSALWWVLIIGGAASFLFAHFDLLQRAFPSLTLMWQARIELVSGFATFVAGYLRMSPLALSHSSELAKLPADPGRTLNAIGDLPKE